MVNGTGAVRIRSARVKDVASLLTFINDLGSDGSLLPRTSSNLLHYLRDFRVAVDDDGRVIGCGALQFVNAA